MWRMHVKVRENAGECKRRKTKTEEKNFKVPHLGSFLESKYEGIIDSVPPPEVYISGVHQHVQNYKPKQAADMIHKSVRFIYLIWKFNRTS
jgi:hypothetical protein